MTIDIRNNVETNQRLRQNLIDLRAELDTAETEFIEASENKWSNEKITTELGEVINNLSNNMMNAPILLE